MKKITFFILLTAILSSQWLIAQDDVLSPFDTPSPSPTHSANLINENYEIPAYNLYLQEWDNDYLKIKSLDINFRNNDDILIILLDDHNTSFSMPCDMYRVSSRYGIRNGNHHTGVDLALTKGAPIRCCFDGVVRMTKDYSSYGKTVVVRHYNGLETVYAHLDSITVVANEIVKAGQMVGTAGSTGRSSGVHLHFETRFLYEHFNPEKMIDFSSGDLTDNILAISKSELDFDKPTEEPAKEPSTTSATTANTTAAATPSPKTSTTTTATATTATTTPISPTTPNTPDTTTPTTTPSISNTGNTPTVPAQNDNSNNEQAVYHTVAQGDTLYGIAKKYNTTVNKLKELNHLGDENKIQLGQKLRVK